LLNLLFSLLASERQAYLVYVYAEVARQDLKVPPMVARMQRRTFALKVARSLVTAYKEIGDPVTLALY
jgi:hypothetical protein